ncbi:MAG: hypothetical protein WCP56_03865 [Candidatus Saccharibacteria bacterium]
MKNLNQNNNFSFAGIATAVIITAGLALGLSMPAIKSWQTNSINKLIEQANASNDPATKTSLLAQAALLGKNDAAATNAYASNLWEKGEYKQSIDVYTSSWVAPNYNFLGELALKSGDTQRAKVFFSKANAAGENADSLSGLAIVEFNNNNSSKGCEYAKLALKLNLSSTKAEQANTLCLIEQGKSSLDKRQQIYEKLNAYIYSDALAELQQLAIKNTADWQAIAAIYANSGKLDEAIGALKAGLEQNPANRESLETLIKYLKIQDKVGESKIYSDRLQDLEFKNYPNK